ncbi:LPXTG cell wall anchor domain-containing protein [Vagococcus entomophilus]|nr:LPXTG cell wall anchor domain-containing protein [Vagococcus entomophilus]
MKRRSKLMLVSTILLGMGLGMETMPAQAETANDPAPVIQPASGTVKNKKVLFDNTHAQTAGAADWVIDGGFSDYANALAQDGFYVKELRQTTPITLDDLKGYDVFVIPEANIPYKTSEQQAISDYVEQGGSVFYIADHYNADRNKNRWDASEVFNGYRRGAYTEPTKGMTDEEKNSTAMQGVTSSDWLSSTFGVRFRYNALDNLENAGAQTLDNTFGILDGVTNVALHAGSTIAITNPEVAKGLVYLPSGLTSANKWSYAVDQGVYNGGGIAEGAYVAIAKKGLGKAAFIGDSSAVEDATPKYANEEAGTKKATYDGFKEASDAQLLLNLTNWLSQEESYKTFTEKGISLSSKTVLNDDEAPEKTTESQSEPWSTSKAGYKWWDATTFANGAYGSTVAPVKSASYYFNFPTEIKQGQEVAVDIQFSDLTPNETVTGYNVGVYTSTAVGSYTQGAQIGFIKVADEAMPTKPGYSDKFSITADANGTATKTIKVRVDEAGTFNIRLRKDSSALKTYTGYTIVPSGTPATSTSETTESTTGSTSTSASETTESTTGSTSASTSETTESTTDSTSTSTSETTESTTGSTSASTSETTESTTGSTSTSTSETTNSTTKEKNTGTSQTDNNTGISVQDTNGVLPNGFSIKVTAIHSGENYLQLKKQFEKFELFDIALTSNGAAIEPTGKVTVSIPIPAGYNKNKLAVYYVAKDNAKLVDTQGKVVGNYFVFETDHFSQYALVEQTKASTDMTASTNRTKNSTEGITKGKTTAALPQTGEKKNEMFKVVGALMVVVFALFVGFFRHKRVND